MTDTSSEPRDIGAEARDETAQAGRRAAEDARNVARDAAERARDEAYAQGDRAKAGVASEMSGVADALRKAADEMRSGSPQERTMGQLAGALADASEAIRDRDLGEIASDVSGMARRNPLAFLGGAALAGFAATRFARASSQPPRDRTQVGSTPSDTGGSLATSASPDATPAHVDPSDIPGPATQPATSTTGTGASAAPAVKTTPYTTGER